MFLLLLLQTQSAALRQTIQQAPKLAFEIPDLTIDRQIGFPSAVAMNSAGLIYVLQRGEESDPVIVVNQQGKVVRSWGKGMFKIPHSIRIDPSGNIWTVDAASSLVYKFTPQGKKLMEISVGGQPQTKSDFNGTTAIAFAPNGHLFISDGYGNARIFDYTAVGKKPRERGNAGTGHSQFHH